MGMLNPCEMLDKTMRSIKEHNDALEDIPICDRLKNAGYTYERVYREDGTYRGIRIMKDGECVHCPQPLATADYAVSLCESAGF